MNGGCVCDRSMFGVIYLQKSSWCMVRRMASTESVTDINSGWTALSIRACTA